MPLIKSKSKKAFESNMEAEMHAGKPKAQSLAIAYSVKRKAPKKKASGGTVSSGSKDMNYADGGAVSAKTEKRPMPDQTTDSTKMKNENANKKELYESGWTDRPDIAQSQRGPKTERVKHPKMVKSDVLQVRLRDDEDDLQSSAGTNEGPQSQPPQSDDETDATKRGRSPTKQTSISTGKQVMAEGGKVEASDYDHTDPNADTDSDMHLSPAEDEGMGNAQSRNEERPDRQGPTPPDKSRPHSANLNSYAQGGEVDEPDSMDQPEPEQEDEHHDSIASAIMANRDRMHAEIDSGSRDLDEAVRMAEGGQVNIDDNNNEEPNAYPPMNGDALDHNMNDAFSDMEQPNDSNMIDDDRENSTSDKKDMVDSIRKKLKSKWRLSEV